MRSLTLHISSTNPQKNSSQILRKLIKFVEDFVEIKKFTTFYPKTLSIITRVHFIIIQLLKLSLSADCEEKFLFQITFDGCEDLKEGVAERGEGRRKGEMK